MNKYETKELAFAINYLTPKALLDLCVAGRLTGCRNDAERKEGLLGLLGSIEGIRGLYANLTEAERKLIDLHVLSLGNPDPELIIEIASQYNLLNARSWDSDCVFYYVRDTDPMNIFFFGHSEMPKCIMECLGKIIRNPLLDAIAPIDNLTVISRANRVSDFASLVFHFANVNAEGYRGLAARSALSKALEFGGWDDVAESDDGTMCSVIDVKKARNLKITSAMYIVAKNAELFAVGKENAAILSSPDNVLAEYLLDTYVKRNLFNEACLCPGFAPVRHFFEWDNARRFVVDLLKDMPPGEFVDSKRFMHYARLRRYTFMHESRGAIYMVSAREQVSYNWCNYEERYLEIFLRCLCAIGIVDLAFCERSTEGRQGNSAEVGIKAIRLNSLGTYLLGLDSDYVPKETQKRESGFVVTPDFTVHVFGKDKILEHGPYLASFFTKSEGSDDSISFKLDLLGLFKALESGTSGETIMKFLKSASSKPIPENVLLTWDNWIKKSKKVRIRKVSLLELEDNAMNKGMLSKWGECARDDGLLFAHIGPNAVEIKADNIRKAKNLIKKNGWYVKVQENIF
ncbi:MAG: hypothetical protein LBT59_26210 [Clostridiales bacterium]|nr:hypothetical protein [Clostridiales bacterium]